MARWLFGFWYLVTGCRGTARKKRETLNPKADLNTNLGATTNSIVAKYSLHDSDFVNFDCAYAL